MKSPANIYLPAHTALQRFFLRMATVTGYSSGGCNSMQVAVSEHNPASGILVFSGENQSASIL